MIFLSEQAIKIRQIMKTTGQGRLKHRGTVFLQHLPSLLKTQRIDILRTCHSDMKLEKPHKMILAETTDRCQIPDRQRLWIMDLNIIQNRLQLVALRFRKRSASILRVR